MEAGIKKQKSAARRHEAVANMARPQRITPAPWTVLYAALFAAYGPQYWWPAQTKFEMILGAYLTQATSWRSVERSLENLRAADLLNINGIRKTSAEDLRALIRPSGFAIRKSASIHAFVEFLDQHHGGSLDQLRQQSAAITRQQLLELPGVGAETADAILLYALDHPAIVVDEYLRRVGRRHALPSPAATDAELRASAVTLLNQPETMAPRIAHATSLEDAKEFHALIVEVGKRHCGPTPRCEGCPLQKYLP